MPRGKNVIVKRSSGGCFLVFHIEFKTEGGKTGTLVGGSTFPKTWQPVLDPWDPHHGSSKTNSYKLSSDLRVHAATHLDTYTFTCMHTHATCSKYKCNKLVFNKTDDLATNSTNSNLIEYVKITWLHFWSCQMFCTWALLKMLVKSLQLSCFSNRFGKAGRTQRSAQSTQQDEQMCHVSLNESVGVCICTCVLWGVHKLCVYMK